MPAAVNYSCPQNQKKLREKRSCKETERSVLNLIVSWLGIASFPYSSYAKACCHMKVPLWQIIPAFSCGFCQQSP